MAVAPLNVTLGWHLDSRKGPLLEFRFGAPVVGSVGLLGLRSSKSPQLRSFRSASEPNGWRAATYWSVR